MAAANANGSAQAQAQTQTQHRSRLWLCICSIVPSGALLTHTQPTPVNAALMHVGLNLIFIAIVTI